MRKPAAVLWDMDGTLIDSEHYWLASEAALAAEFGKQWTPQDGMDLVGMSLYESSVILKQRLEADISPDAIIDRLTNEVVAQLNKHIPWRPGAKELLHELREQGVRTALVTMSLRRMANRVVEALNSEFGVGGAFDQIIGGDDVTVGKPDPEPYLEAARRLGVAIEDCVALEDSVNGLTSAERSGAAAIGIPHIVSIPERPGRILWSSLEGKTVAHLSEILQQANSSRDRK